MKAQFNSESNDLEKLYNEAIELASSHYENFPVVSKFLPSQKRKYVAVIYQFARTADDFADEGNDLPEVKMQMLNDYESKFLACLNGNFHSPFWCLLNDSINKAGINPENLLNLLKAFKQDVTKTRYTDFNDVLNYCKNSANPVGRLILELFNIKDAESYKYSDDICTALQITNFYQDVSIDILKGRIYIPLDELKQFNVDEADFYHKIWNENFRNLLEFQVMRARKMFISGRRLLERLPFRLKIQIKWTILGGEEILKKIIKNDYKVVECRPKLSKFDYIWLLIKSFLVK